MIKTPISIILSLVFIFIAAPVIAQEPDSDTFFLARKKGLLGRLGKSISTNGNVIAPVKTVNPFIKFAGKRIASITIVSLGLNKNMEDTGEVKKSFVLNVANAFHKNTKESFIRDNLFFREGDVIVPLMLSDNERFLREQEYLRDASITVLRNVNSSELVDVVVVTRDVFSLGGSVSVNSTDKGEVEIKEENVGGRGARLSLFTLYDKDRSPQTGFGGEFLKRNINGNFFNWKAGFRNYNNAYSSGREEETRYYTSVERPLVSRYTRWTGALELDYNTSKNNYEDTLFDSHYRYKYLRTDIWGGYNIGARRKRMTDHMNRLRHFIAIRTFYTRFYQRPLIFKDSFNYNYADINGVLFAYSLFKQNFYKTNFIYGFGRNEDVPVGLSVSGTLGRTNKDGKVRNYYGISGEASKYTRWGNYYAFNLRAGSFTYNNHFEDVDVLIGIDHFTALKKLGSSWRNRNFINLAFTRQHNHLLNPPLFLQSEFGLPYYPNGYIEANMRASLRMESVFFNMTKVLGFRFAPFAFAGTSLITPMGKHFSSSKGYTALGGGFRTRNENLVLGTIEVKAFYFTRKTFPDMKNWKIDISTNLKFRYNSTFIRKPDFVIAN